MKYMKQLGIIMFVTLIGEILRYFIPLPIPASIYGLCLMEVLLITKVIKLEQVKEAGLFLIDIMPLMFIPASVGIMTSWGALKDMWFQISVAIILSTIIVMVVSGRVTQFLISRGQKNESNSN